VKRLTAVSGFVPGRALSRAFYEEVVRPLVGGLSHSAALLGTGSDVLGFDTKRSTDHGWGPRVSLFVAPHDVATVSAAAERGLPDSFRGWPTRYGWDDVPVTHQVEVASLDTWLVARLGVDPRRGMSTSDWLATPQQLLLEVTSGEVFYDGLGELERVRELLEWYPRDVWLWLLACQWRRIDQEEPFVGRTAEVGDELGSRVLAARLTRDVVRLCFLLERRYAPYGKWLGSAFRTLDSSSEIGPPLADALVAADFALREARLVTAIQAAAERFNALGLVPPVSTTTGFFYERPFRVLGSGRFVTACLDAISDTWLRSLPLIGSIDQHVDSTDVLSHAEIARRARALYGETT
jgi:Domain of unknown function (DUF4037)